MGPNHTLMPFKEADEKIQKLIMQSSVTSYCIIMARYQSNADCLSSPTSCHGTQQYMLGTSVALTA